MCVCVCVCVRERERERESEHTRSLGLEIDSWSIRPYRLHLSFSNNKLVNIFEYFQLLIFLHKPTQLILVTAYVYVRIEFTIFSRGGKISCGKIIFPSSLN